MAIPIVNMYKRKFGKNYSYVIDYAINGKLATGSLSFEYNLAKWKYVWAQIKFGGVGVIPYAEGNNEFWAYPFAGINFRF